MKKLQKLIKMENKLQKLYLEDYNSLTAQVYGKPIIKSRQ